MLTSNESHLEQRLPLQNAAAATTAAASSSINSSSSSTQPQQAENDPIVYALPKVYNGKTVTDLFPEFEHNKVNSPKI